MCMMIIPIWKHLNLLQDPFKIFIVKNARKKGPLNLKKYGMGVHAGHFGLCFSVVVQFSGFSFYHVSGIKYIHADIAQMFFTMKIGIKTFEYK